MAIRTTDRASDVLTVEQLGRTQELTPEGFLLCREVRIARVGEMLYAADELPELEVGSDGIIRVTRGPEDLFRPETLQSLLGKSFTDEHPDDDVTPDNWEELSGGVVLNPRQGEGPDAEFIIADLLVQRGSAIQAVRDGKREVSMGYDADYEQLGPGKARQFNIIANHVALVDNGRCGPRCAIGDSEMMTRDKKRSWKDRILTAFKARDEEALKEALGLAPATDDEGDLGDEPQRLIIEVKGAAVEAPAASTEDDEGEGGEAAPAWFTAYTTQADARFGKLEAAISKLAGGATQDEEGQGEGEGKEKKDAETVGDDGDQIDMGQTYDEEGEGAEEKKDGDKTRDSAAFVVMVRDTISRAEILAPGIRLPTIDGKVSRKQTLDRMCALRRRAFEAAMDDAENGEIVRPLLAGRSLKTTTCDAMEPLFHAASELVKRANGNVGVIARVHDHKSTDGPVSIADVNKRNREFWTAKGGLSA